MRKLLLFLLPLLFLSVSVPQIKALSLEDCVNGSTDYSGCIEIYQNKLNGLSGQKNTLANQIAQFNSQIQLTQLKISDAQTTINNLEKEISALGTRIGYIATSVDKLQVLLKQRIVATYQQGFVSNLEIIMSSQNFSDFILRAQYLRQVQENDRKILTNLQETKANYANQKDEREVKQAAIEENQKKLLGLKRSLDEQKAEQQTLLTVTQNDETKYQELLSEAQAQISAFKSFSSSKGGGILPAQSSPDGWFYSQRDERWARNFIGASSENILDVGCLVSSMAMVMKKHGQNVTPADIASNKSYYFADTAYTLIPWAGGKFSSTWGYNKSAIDAKLASGEPVIIGLHAGVYGQHFIVLKSGSNGNYKINDPWNGTDLNFSDFYSTSQIFQYGFYNG